MSSVVISGDVSGSVTLQAPSAAGTTVLTLPATSGTVVTTATSTGISGSAISTGTVGVSVGGTGANTLTANNVILGNGTSAVQFVAPGSNGNLLTSNGTTWTSAAAPASGGLTLLGTVSATSGNSVSLGSLNLTSYKALFIALNNVAINTTATVWITSNNTQSGGGFFIGGVNTANNGVGWLDLSSGSFSGISDQAGSGSGKTNVSTSTTTLYFRVNASGTFSGSGSFIIYGDK